MTTPTLTPRLIVKDADAAIAFYRSTLGAKLLERYHDSKLDAVVHAALSINGAIMALAEHHPEWDNREPLCLGGAAVLMELEVDDPDVTAARMVEAGGTTVFPVADQFYGKRSGRIRDPFGHVWILSKTLQQLSAEEIQRRVDRFHDDPKDP